MALSGKSTDKEIQFTEDELRGTLHAAFHFKGLKVDTAASQIKSLIEELCKNADLELTSLNVNYYYAKDKS